MIYDCFLFHNELELLELRLAELSDAVDMFVLCESPRTFTGKDKPLHFHENKLSFVLWLPKIRYLCYDQDPHEDPWRNEWAQRDFLERGLVDAEPEDVVLLSDVDEIPRAESIPATPPDPPVIFQQRLYYYYVNCFQEQVWRGTLAGSRESLHPFSMQRPGDLYRRREKGQPTRKFSSGQIIDGGWHFSFLGGVERIKDKIESYSETGTDTDEVKDDSHLRHCLSTGADLFGRKDPRFEKVFVPINDTFPKALPAWLTKYPHMAKEVPVA